MRVPFASILQNRNRIIMRTMLISIGVFFLAIVPVLLFNMCNFYCIVTVINQSGFPLKKVKVYYGFDEEHRYLAEQIRPDKRAILFGRSPLLCSQMTVSYVTREGKKEEHRIEFEHTVIHVNDRGEITIKKAIPLLYAFQSFYLYGHHDFVNLSHESYRSYMNE